MNLLVFACKVFLCHMLYFFNMYNCIWFIVMDYYFVLYIFVVLLIYYQSVMYFFFLCIYLCFFFVAHVLSFFEIYCHIIIIINNKLSFTICWFVWWWPVNIFLSCIIHCFTFPNQSHNGTNEQNVKLGVRISCVPNCP